MVHLQVAMETIKGKGLLSVTTEKPDTIADTWLFLMSGTIYTLLVEGFLHGWPKVGIGDQVFGGYISYLALEAHLVASDLSGVLHPDFLVLEFHHFNKRDIGAGDLPFANFRV